jgi:hypothetical protein
LPIAGATAGATVVHPFSRGLASFPSRVVLPAFAAGHCCEGRTVTRPCLQRGTSRGPVIVPRCAPGLLTYRLTTLSLLTQCTMRRERGPMVVPRLLMYCKCAAANMQGNKINHCHLSTQ